jgi:hypothetical protein
LENVHNNLIFSPTYHHLHPFVFEYLIKSTFLLSSPIKPAVYIVPIDQIDIMATEHNAQARAVANGEPLEKDFSRHSGGNTLNGNNQHYTNGANNYHMNDMNLDNDTALKRIRTAGSISISPELFEKIYLSPQNAVKGDLRKTFGNPTPV